MDILKSTIYEKEKSSEMKTKNILEKNKADVYYPKYLIY